MSKYFSTRTSVCNVVCAVLLIILLVLQFLPFWQFGENLESSASIQGYTWFPGEYSALDKHIAAQTDADYVINSILFPPIAMLLLAAAGVVFCLFMPKRLWSSFCAIACGAVGVWGYLTKAPFKLGVNWQLHVVICVALVLAGLAACLLGNGKKEKTER